MIRTRFAPSPTGSLHVGNARIAVLNWLFTRRHGGRFILRIEDTDVERNLAGAEAGIRHDLLWLGIDWDEGPDRQGDHGPYRQSERGAAYRRCADRLLEKGAAYLCFCAAGPAPDAGAATAAQERRDRCSCAGLDPARSAGRAASEPSVVRFRVPRDEVISFDDTVRGRVEVAAAEIADFVLLRPDGRPTYNFAVVVDDIAMAITHVIRGVGHLSNTPRQVLLFRAFEMALPAFVHVPMVLGPDRQKLSKRHGAQGMAEYRAAGYHPDGLLNYLSLLSWSSPSGDDVLTRERLIEEVSLERIGAADAMFDPVKLRWLSAKHIERMPLPELVAAVRPCLAAEHEALDDERLTVAVAAVRTHLATFSDINEQLEGFRAVAPAATEPGPVVAAAHALLAGLDAWTEPALKEAIQQVGRDTGARGRELYEPLRRALTGREHGPPLAAVLFVQGRELALSRLAAAAA
jgi:nondiscriminating glutamyl-tRNA synthetase